MPGTPVLVTGVGPVSAIGCGRNPFWDALVEGRSGVGPITLCDASASPSKIGAEVKGFALEDYVEGGRVLARHTPRPVQLALAASVLALHDAEVDLDAFNPDRLGIHVGTSIGNLSEAFRLRDMGKTTGTLPPYAAFHTFNHSAACILSSFFNIRGPVHTTTSGCNSGLDAIGQSLRMIQAGAADAMLVVGTDCELVPEVLQALNASRSLATKYNDRPAEASRPFECGRDGNVIGEGAAALLLESAPHARLRGARAYARVVGYQICSAGRNRQYSHDAPELDLRPCVRAFRAALLEADWTPESVDLVNANGSSSVIYDRLEALALAEVLGDALPRTRVHSIKSMLGQHGAGSSALQAVTACLTLRRGTIPPTINHERPDPACGPLRVVTKPERFDGSRVLVHSIGIGGFYYSVGAFEKPRVPSAFAPGSAADATGTGRKKVSWSRQEGARFHPGEAYQKPLTPWKPRSD